MTFVNTTNLPTPRAVYGIDGQRDNILSFLQGSVYCWCKNRKNEPFAARDLLGGDNYYWQDTPMMALYEYYRAGDDAATSKFAITDEKTLTKLLNGLCQRYYTTEISNEKKVALSVDVV